MAKKTRKELDEELEDEDLDDEEDDDFDDEDEDEDDEDDEDEDDYDEEELEEGALAGPDEEADPYWWTPHLVLGLLLVVALLGFFGAFNPWFGHLAPSPDTHDAHSMTEDDAAAPGVSPTAAAPPAKTVQIRPPQDATIYGARHILVQYTGAQKAPPTMTRTKEEAKKIADAAAVEAKKTVTADNRAAAWKAIAVKHDDPNAEKTGGDLGRFRHSAYDTAFVEAVAKMKVGEVGGPVDSPFGYRIIWRTL